MVDRGSGSIVNIASLLSFQGGVLVPAYAASKHALAGLTKALANEWAGAGCHRQRSRPRLHRHRQHRRPSGRPRPRAADPGAHPAGRWGEPPTSSARWSSSRDRAARYVTGHVLSSTVVGWGDESQPAGQAGADRPSRPARRRRQGRAGRRGTHSHTGISEISRATGLPTSTVHRIIQDLVAFGWVRGDGERGYLPGGGPIDARGTRRVGGAASPRAQPVAGAAARRDHTHRPLRAAAGRRGNLRRQDRRTARVRDAIPGGTRDSGCTAPR